MKALLRQTCLIASASVLITTSLRADNLPAGFVDFGKFTKPANGQLVDIHLNSDMIAIAMQLVGKDQRDILEAFSGLHSVRVNVVGLDDKNREEVTDRMQAVRSGLDMDGWQPLVKVQDKKEDVGIYLKTHGKEAVEGVVVTVLNGRKEAVFINIVGNIKVEKLASLGEKLNLDALKNAAETLQKSTSRKQAVPTLFR